MNPRPPTPAELASTQALNEIKVCITNSESFLLEAGAGAGKTFSLISTLQHLIEHRGKDLLRKQQQIACITYTNVAANEITSRTDGHPAVFSSTIHSFCWRLINHFQTFLRTKVRDIPKFQEMLADGVEITNQTVVYDLGFRKISEREITIHHDDVITLTIECLKEDKFLSRMTAQFPIIFIDEYQDTNKEFVEILKTRILDNENASLIGFFGDHWQKIYGEGCGAIAHDNVTQIGKRANFRSVPVIVDFLNRLRPELPQQVSDPDATGELKVYHSNTWVGARRTQNHWQEDLPAETAHEYLDRLKALLAARGWDLSPEKTKILMLTHNLLADEQGYRNLANAFQYNDSFIKKTDPHLAFFLDSVEPICDAFSANRYGLMFSLLGARTPILTSQADKISWSDDMDELIALRTTGTVREVIELLQRTRRPSLTEAIENKERKLAEWLATEQREESRSLNELQAFKEVAYQEVIALKNFLNGITPFATKHGVKGAQFENVIVVFGRGWNQYNFNQFLEWASMGVPGDKQETFERNRNLFYVACSRPKKRLALLFTQKLSATALATLQGWAGEANVAPL